MDIITKKLEEVKPYENNPRNNTAAVPAVAKSLQSFGWKQPIVIDKDGTIVVGHTRYLAAKQLLADTQDAKWNVLPCVIADDLTEDEITAYRLADNKTNELAVWDDMKLEGELGKLADVEIDMSVFGFDKQITPDDFGDDFTLEDGDKNEICTMTFTLHEKQKQLIENAMKHVSNNIIETFGNTNKNGNEIYEVVRQWEEQKKS